MSDPVYLSIVATAATQRFVDAILAHPQLSAELILVDPAPGLEFPPEVRTVVSGAKSEWTARNAGIRRARGEFILCTSAEAIFPDPLVEFLASRQLRPGHLYRVKQQPTGLRADSDIAGDGIELGARWYPPEGGASGIFRRIDQNAELLLRVPVGGGILRLEFETGGKPITLLDAGKPVAERTIAGRDTIRINVPSSTKRLALRTDGPTRVFRCDWHTPPPPAERAAADVMRADRQRDPAVYRRFAHWWKKLPAAEVRLRPA